MRPALKKIVNLLKENESPMDIDGYYSVVKDVSKCEEFIKTHCIHLHNPVLIKAGTKWTSKSSSSGTIHGKFKVDCKAIGVVKYVGTQLVLDKRSSICNPCEKLGGKLNYLVTLSTLDTELLEKIANEL